MCFTWHNSSLFTGSMRTLLIALLLILAGCSKPAPVVVAEQPNYELIGLQERIRQADAQAKADEEARTVGKAIFGAQQQGR